jgi:ferredoxin
VSEAVSFRVGLIGVDGRRVEFAAPPAQSLVKAAARAGYLVTTGCLQGRCAICRARLLSGAVIPLRRPSPNAVSAGAQLAAGLVLMCSVAAGSDVELAPLSAWRVPVAR